MVAPNPDVSLHFLGQDGLLFDASRRKLYELNTAATMIWCCLVEGMTPEAISLRLAEASRFRYPEAATYVRDMLVRWGELGLISERSGHRPQSPAEAGLPGAPATVAPTQPCPPARIMFHRIPELGARPAEAGADYRLLDLRFRLQSSSRMLLRLVEPLLSSLALPSGDGEPVTRMALEFGPRGFTLAAEGREVERCHQVDRVVPMLRASLLQLALQQSDDFGALHAAAAGRDGRCILLPGPSGSGKSTIAAALVSAGFQLLGDDTVVLAEPDLRARGTPFAVCLKAGAWTLLADRFPALGGEPIHNRPDGKRVRFLALPRHARASGTADRWQISSIVFLHQGNDGPSALEPLATIEALRRLLSGFVPLGSGLDRNKVDRLLRWIESTDCFELRSNSLEASLALLDGLGP